MLPSWLYKIIKLRSIINFSGSWSVQFERGDAVATIRSLLWIGSIFYHVPDSRHYGQVYVGNGEMNLDLPFML